MATFLGALDYFFYGATILAIVFFLHKVLWLVQYKRVQRALIDEALRGLREGNEAILEGWEELARGCWQNALGQAEIRSPSTFVRRVEEGLARLKRDLRGSRKSIEEILGPALESASGGPVTVLSLRRLSTRGPEDRYEVAIDAAFPTIPSPRPPDRRLYELRERSRYGLIRRALVFFSGIADVVYSAQHVALMSQNVHVPTSVLVRRLAMVLLVLVFVILDMVSQGRQEITAQLALVLGEPKAPAKAAAVVFGMPWSELLGWGAWLSIYGVIYLGVYFWIRRHYQVNVRRLKAMHAGEEAALRAIREAQTAELGRWGRAYGKSLDAAVEITVAHAETLVDHYVHRLRRRVAAPALLAAAKTIADSLFLRLPESKGELVDVATTQRHSFKHYLWPRREEMGYQLKLAQYRAAWQDLEITGNALRGERPDPSEAHELWRRAITYARMFAPLLPSGTAEEIEQGYAQMVTECVAETDRDLAELDRQLRALTRALAEQLESARALALSRVELAGLQVQAAAAARVAEVIRVREQARLEAMAFEI